MICKKDDNNMNIMFMGTPEFAVASLEALYAHEGFCVTSVVTREDKPRGRGHKMAHTAVYDCAAAHGTRIYQPKNLKKENFEEILLAEKPDLIAVVAYGRILPEYVLEFPRYGCVNVHSSLLPKYRGAAPMQWCVINGEKTSGVTTMLMNKGLDTGDMLMKEAIDILPDDTFETIHDKLAPIGARLLVSTAERLADGTAVREPQDESLMTYAPMIDKATAHIDWTKTADEVRNLIRGLYPFPCAYTVCGGKIMKIESARTVSDSSAAECGTVTAVGENDFTVSCGGGTALAVERLRPEGKRSMNTADFLRGNSIERGTVLS